MPMLCRTTLADPDGGIGYVVLRPRQWHLTNDLPIQSEDYLWAVVFATKPSKLTLTSGSNVSTFKVSIGVNKFKLANSPGAIRAQLADPITGIPTLDVNPGIAKFNWVSDNPQTYNFNAFVAYGP